MNCRVALPSEIMTELQTLPENTIELGMGAHGEPGLKQLSPIPAPAELTRTMIDLLTDVGDTDRAFIPFTSGSSDEVILLVNSLGSTSDEVLSRFAELAIAELEKQGKKVRRLTLGPMVTSLKMSGFGFTVWKLPKEGDVLKLEDALDFWDRKVDVVAWRQ
jgi:dihydroxyacetone kinase